MIKRHWPIAIISGFSVIALGFAFALRQTVTYQTDARLLIKLDQSRELVGLTTNVDNLEGLTMDSDPLANQSEIFLSPSVLQRVIDEIQPTNEQGKVLSYQTLAKKFKVQPLASTDILVVTYTDKNPEMAAQILNSAVDAYIENNRQSVQDETNKATAFIEEQLPLAQQELKQQEAQLRAFKNRFKIVDLNQETTSIVNYLASISYEIDQTTIALADVSSRYDALSNQLGMDWQEAAAYASLNESSTLQQLMDRLQTVKVDLAMKSSSLTNYNYQIVDLQEEEGKLSNLLDQQINQALSSQNRYINGGVNLSKLSGIQPEKVNSFVELGLQREGLQNKLASLRNIQQISQNRANLLPELQQVHRDFDRRIAQEQDTFDTLSKQLQNIQLAKQQNLVNVRVLTRAEEPSTGSSAKSKIMIGSILLGGLTGITGAFLVDFLDKKVKNTQEIEEILPYPLHGIVPNYGMLASNRSDSLQKLMASNPSLSAQEPMVLSIVEAYHNIKINLELWDRQRKSKVIAITSAVPKEGKSSIVANLAIAESQAYQNVLVIDCHLRRPSQQTLWQVNNNKGVCEILKQEVPWQDTLINIAPRLDLITAGDRMVVRWCPYWIQSE
ncbi:MAG: polysaccharide biosynthesis tyrosine autokinase [Synechococcaceae cyanobacterium RL_1_2]|nr:polysaccharide biosynthesis tyrosine autokinase [Synechococcaceae cyanobacterium RL_1_2]